MRDVYWHIQMSLPEGRNGRHIDSIKMLEEEIPIIGTGEWDNFQCTNFKHTLEKGDIVCVRDASKVLALCKIIGDSFKSDELQKKYYNINFRKVEVLEFYKGKESFSQPQGTLQKLINKTTPSWIFINSWYKSVLNKKEMKDITDISEF